MVVSRLLVASICLTSVFAASCAKPKVAETKSPASSTPAPSTAPAESPQATSNASYDQRPGTRTGTANYAPLVAGEFDPNKGDFKESRVSSPYDPAKDDPLKPGEQLVPGDNGQQMVMRTYRTPVKGNIYVMEARLRPVDVGPDEHWLVGTVGIMNESQSMNVTDIQISFMHGDERSVILGGKGADPLNPLRNKVLPPSNGDTYQVSAPVKYSKSPGAGGSSALEIELVVDGPPGLLTFTKALEGIRIDPYTGNRLR